MLLQNVPIRVAPSQTYSLVLPAALSNVSVSFSCGTVAFNDGTLSLSAASSISLDGCLFGFGGTQVVHQAAVTTFGIYSGVPKMNVSAMLIAGVSYFSQQLYLADVLIYPGPLRSHIIYSCAKTLPPGITLNPHSGLISGTPLIPFNKTTFAFRLEDVFSHAGAVIAEVTLEVVLPRAASSNSSSAIITALVVLFVVLVLAIFGVYAFRRYRAYKLYLAELADVKRRIPADIIVMLTRMNGGQFLVPRAISPLYLTFLDTLGEGKFGAVMKALLDESDDMGVPGYLVAVKMAKEEASDGIIEEMRTEAAIMAQFQHKNVVGLIGQVSEPGMFLIVLQFCEHGSLLSWITENGPIASMRTLINMCLDTASGMAYLELIGVVHRDLAARNVLVSSDMSCKISDFGLSQHSNDGAVKTDGKDQVAVRWAAPEAIADHRFTNKSDVWSFGVTLYEIFSYGAKPYDAWSNRRMLEEVRKGYRLEMPTKFVPL